MAEEQQNMEAAGKKRMKRSFTAIILDKVRSRAASKRVAPQDLKAVEEELKVTLKKFEDIIKQSKKVNQAKKNHLSKLDNYTVEEIQEYLRMKVAGK